MCCHISGQRKQCIQVDIIFNCMFHFGLPGTCLYNSPENNMFWRVCFNYFYKDMCLGAPNVVKYDVYVEILLMVSIY